MKRIFVVLGAFLAILICFAGCRRQPKADNMVNESIHVYETNDDDISHTNDEIGIREEEGHSYGAWKANNDGMSHTRVCSCGEKETEAHTFSFGQITEAATHTSEGIKTFTCVDCGTTKTETILPNINNHSYGAWVSNYDGVTHSRICSCGEKETEAHNFSFGQVTKAATHTSEGIKLFSCSDCGETKTESIPANVNDHSYGSWKQYDCEYHIKYCQCGSNEKTEHTFDAGVVRVEPTTTDYGIINYTCIGCGFTYDDLIPMLEDAHTQEAPTQETQDYYYQCVCNYCDHYDGAKHLVLYNGVKVDVIWVCSACGRENWNYMTYSW